MKEKQLSCFLVDLVFGDEVVYVGDRSMEGHGLDQFRDHESDGQRHDLGGLVPVLLGQRDRIGDDDLFNDGIFQTFHRVSGEDAMGQRDDDLLRAVFLQ